MIGKTKLFLLDIVDKRSVIVELAKRDFKEQYMGSYLGTVWGYLQPLLFLLVLYLVFSVGFRAGKSSNMPFAVYLVTGMVLWMYFSVTLSSMADVVKKYSFLISKVDFRLSILPIVKILSGLFTHLFFISVAVIIAWCNGFPPSFFIIQVLYYLFSTVCLLLGLGWLASSTNLFINDVSKIISVLVQFGFWLTPIFWETSMVPERYRWIIKLNPVHYLIQGYRESIVTHIPLWQHPLQGIYFWSVTAILLLLGISVFGKLRPHFAEVV